MLAHMWKRHKAKVQMATSDGAKGAEGGKVKANVIDVEALTLDLVKSLSLAET